MKRHGGREAAGQGRSEEEEQAEAAAQDGQENKMEAEAADQEKKDEPTEEKARYVHLTVEAELSRPMYNELMRADENQD